MGTARIVFDKWDGRYAERMTDVRSSAVRDLFAAASRPDIISFAGGMPDVARVHTDLVCAPRLQPGRHQRRLRPSLLDEKVGRRLAPLLADTHLTLPRRPGEALQRGVDAHRSSIPQRPDKQRSVVLLDLSVAQLLMEPA